MNLELSIESLERRAMLAGDVSVSVAGSNLVIQGDELDNRLVIQSTEDVGTLLILGVDGTTIDGESSKIVENATGGVRATLKGGDDAILIKRQPLTPFQLRGRVRIDSGDGDDVVGVFGVDVRGSTSISTKDGDDYVHFGNSRTIGLKVQTGDGNDVAYLHNSDHVGVFKIRTGNGDDVVRSGFNDFFTSAKSIKAGAGNDLVDVRHSQFRTSRAPLVHGQSGRDGLYSDFSFATGNRNKGFEYASGINGTNDAFESHPGTPIFNDLFSFGSDD